MSVIVLSVRPRKSGSSASAVMIDLNYFCA
jgi:hypothetical protein